MGYLLSSILYSNITLVMILIVIDSPNSRVSAFIFNEKHKTIFSKISITQRLELINNFIAVNDKVIPKQRRVKVERYTLNAGLQDSFADVTNTFKTLPKPPSLDRTKWDGDESDNNETENNIGRSNLRPYRIKMPEPLDRWLYRDVNSIMKEKLFRLMYETYKYSDLIVLKTLKIKEAMGEKSTFLAGYILAAIFQKYEKMIRTSNNMHRSFLAWRSIEHVNGYEQIYELSIEIIELVAELKKVDEKVMHGDIVECDENDIDCILQQMEKEGQNGPGG